MRFEEKGKSHKGLIFLGIFLAVIIFVASCDFAPKQETVQVEIQHTLD